MFMKKLIKVNKLTNEKYLNLFNVTYLQNNKEYVWTFSSRRNQENLGLYNNKKTDAVMILPYFTKNNKLYVVAIKEFRSCINDYTYSLPAGIIEDNEESQNTAIREIAEEIGASVISIKKVLNGSLTSAGLTDEKLECFEAEIILDKKQNLEDCEDITLRILAIDDIIDFVDNNPFCLPAGLLLKMFYYKNNQKK